MVTTDNERRIMSAIEQQGPLTKGDLIDLLGISWATVAKLVNRLTDKGLLVKRGTVERELQIGKNSYLYDLARESPVAVGVDVEYGLTRVVLTNLRREELASRSVATTPVASVAGLVDFLHGVIQVFLGREASAYRTIEGIGVAIPALLVPGSDDIYGEVSRGLAARFSCRIRVENVVRAYTLYGARLITPPGNFMITTIRSGIGCGLFINGEIYRGDTGLAGEVSHLKVVAHGARCKCGNTGCLETVVNENLLYEAAAELSEIDSAAPGAPLRGALANKEQRLEALSRLFVLAKNGHPQARAVVEPVARLLAQAFATLFLAFDIPRLYLCGHFGQDGTVLAGLIRTELHTLLDQRFGHEVRYRPLNDAGFSIGAAFLVLHQYLAVSGTPRDRASGVAITTSE